MLIDNPKTMVKIPPNIPIKKKIMNTGDPNTTLIIIGHKKAKTVNNKPKIEITIPLLSFFFAFLILSGKQAIVDCSDNPFTLYKYAT
jgi:hypothetical protein